jgi:peptidoglycan/xylan/chitin deacetylase (PgdA/CDA1 family)
VPATVVLSFDVDAETVILVEGRRYAENPTMMSHQRYGPTVGVPRILGLLAEYDLPATFFVPGYTADRYPDTVEQILAAGHEIGHHSYTHHSPLTQSADEERRDFERALAALERHGIEPEGYRTPSWEPSWRTHSLLAEHGLAYDSSLADDDHAYVLETDKGDLVELPISWWLDDWQQTAYLPPIARNQTRSQHEVAELWTTELDAYARYGGLFVLTCHPFLTGRPGRLEAVRDLIEHAQERGDVEFLDGRTAAARARGNTATARRRHEPLEVDPELYPAE